MRVRVGCCHRISFQYPPIDDVFMISPQNCSFQTEFYPEVQREHSTASGESGLGISRCAGRGVRGRLVAIHTTILHTIVLHRSIVRSEI